MAAGAFIGQMFEYRYFVNTGLINNCAWAWYKSSPLKVVLRILATAVALFICLVPIAFSDGIVEQLDEDQIFGRATLRMIFSFILPGFLVGFVAFGMLRFLFNKFKLDNDDAQGKEFRTREQYLRDIGLELVTDGLPSRRERRKTGSRNQSEVD